MPLNRLGLFSFRDAYGVQFHCILSAVITDSAVLVHHLNISFVTPQLRSQ